MTAGFRRVCTGCRRTVGWHELTDDEGRFYHWEEGSELCAGVTVDLEAKEFGDEGEAGEAGESKRKEGERG